MAQAYSLEPATIFRSVLQTGIIYNATAGGAECPFGEVYTTDGRIKGLDLVLLTDDRSFFPHYNPAVTLSTVLAPNTPRSNRS